MASTKIWFGKHSGKTIEELVKTQKGYCDWYLKQEPTTRRCAEFKERMLLYYQEVYNKTAVSGPDISVDDDNEWVERLTNKLNEIRLDPEDVLPDLDPKQKQAVEAFLSERKNIFLSGMAGSGKSVVIKYIRSKRPKVLLVAPTWLAAANIGGDSIHRAFRIKPGIEKEIKYLQDGQIDPDWLKEICSARDKLVYDERIRAKVVQRGLSRTTKEEIFANGIIIDEISMVSGKMFELLDQILRYDFDVMDRPFGGCQLMVVGDFAQLSPIDDVPFHKYPFQTPIWQELYGYPTLREISPQTYILNICHRQDKDGDFYRALEKTRSECDYDYFTSRIITQELKDYFLKDEYEQFFWLMPTNAECDSINKRYLDRIPGTSSVFPSIDNTGKALLEKSGPAVHDPKGYPGPEPSGRDPTDSNDKFTLPSTLEIKPGAKVRLIKSLQNKSILYNGRGLRIVFINPASDSRKMLDYLHEESLAAIKGELVGKTGEENRKIIRELEKRVSLSKAFPELLCVLEDEYQLVDLNDPRPLKEKFDPASLIVIRPYLQCRISLGKIFETRIQYPLRLNYASTVHRAQGLTLSKTVIGTDRIFASGQFYTALSREKKVDDVFILGDLPKINNIDPVLKEYIDLLDMHANI
jgi:hypothetical protein